MMNFPIALDAFSGYWKSLEESRNIRVDAFV
jgi:hypothetical protein